MRVLGRARFLNFPFLSADDVVVREKDVLSWSVVEESRSLVRF
jgi:hypothetical protein